MQRSLAVLACLVFVLVGCGKHTSKSSASLTPDQRYVSDVRGATIGAAIIKAPDADISKLGHGICDLMDQGVLPPDISAGILKGRNMSDLNSADAASTVSAAVRDLCPVHDGLIQAWDGAPTPVTTTPVTTTPSRPTTTTTQPATAPPTTTIKK